MRPNTRILILVGLFQLLGTVMSAQTKKETPSSDLERLTVPDSANGIDDRSRTIYRGSV
jgi:hypothetical protein